MAARLTVLLSSPRVAAGLLSHGAWTALGEADTVLVRDETNAQVAALNDAGMSAVTLGAESPAALARTLVDRAEQESVVWVGSGDGDPGLTDALAAELTRRPQAPEVEIAVASWDVPGSRLLDVVAVMDRLRSPGGCPWDAEQTHESLAPYLIEETYEAVEAIESGDRAHLTEELGDVLLQVAFHSRVAQEDPDDPFDIDDVAADLVAKLVRRHPHVFGDVTAANSAEVSANWEAIKAQEKPERESVLDGIPAALPPLARATKVVGRLERAGRQDLLADATAVGDPGGQTEGDLGAQLLGLVIRARADGVDPSAALRATLRTLEQHETGAC